MKKTGIFYGSTTGTTETIARQIATLLDVSDADIYDVANAEVSSVDAYEVLILGSSTWGLGELQDDWYSFLDKLKKTNLISNYTLTDTLQSAELIYGCIFIYQNHVFANQKAGKPC